MCTIAPLQPPQEDRRRGDPSEPGCREAEERVETLVMAVQERLWWLWAPIAGLWRVPSV